MIGRRSLFPPTLLAVGLLCSVQSARAHWQEDLWGSDSFHASKHAHARQLRAKAKRRKKK